jgi:signal transduction histidine kinase
MSPITHLVRRAALGLASLVLGAATATLELICLLVTTPVHAIPAARPGIEAMARRFVDLERRRLVALLDYDDRLYVVPEWRRAYSYLARRITVGCIGLVVLILVTFGLMSGLIMTWQVVRGEPIGGASAELARDRNQLLEATGAVAIGLVLLFMAVWGLIGVATLERTLADRYFVPSEADRLRRRVSELADTRAAVVGAVNDERRRIERDLHDGVQQRLVALGMLLGRALRAKEHAQVTRLLTQAHEESRQALNDLREVTWRVYPTALDKDGLHAALEGVADRASVPVMLRYELTARPDLATETVVYFVASEAVTNALKHGDPASITIVVTQEENDLIVTVHDNGHGGADVTGSGLSGLASRVAAADGQFFVNSPTGGPTEISARLPVVTVPDDALVRS